MIIKSGQALKILAHIDKMWDQNKEEVMKEHQLKEEYRKVEILGEWERDIKILKAELLEKLVNPQGKPPYLEKVIVSHNKEETIITMNCGSVFQGEFICYPMGSVHYKDLI